MRLVSLLAACTLAAALLPGCGKSESATTSSAKSAGGHKTLRIAVIPKGTTSEYWKAVHAGAVKAVQELAKTQPVEIIWRGSLREDQSDQEINVVEDMINQQVDAIVLAPNNADALARPVEEAAARHIPVVIIDSAVNTDKYTAFVATDNKKGGTMGGNELATELGGKGKVIMLRYQEGSASTNDREEGAIAALKSHPGIQLESTNKYGGVTEDACQKSAENLLAAYQNADGSLSIQGIFCPNQTTTFGMLRALEENKEAGKVKFVGFDANVALVNGLKAGEINALVVQDPVNMGYMGVKTAVDIIDGKKVPRQIDTGVHLITKENMNSPESRDILNPPIAKYLKE